MNRDNLETYLNIVKTRSFTKTAEQMFISQSAVSNRLVNLETELGVKLIERSPGQKGIDLTQKGEEFREYAQHYLELEQQVMDWSRGNTTQVLRVASVISLTDYILNGFYFQLLSSRKLSLSIATHWSDRIISMLENRETDVGITPRVFYSKAINADPLFDEPLYLVYNTTVSRYPEYVDLTQLRRSDEVYFDWGLKFVEWHDQQMSPLEPPLVVTDTTKIIPELLRIPNSFSIIPRALYKHYNDPQLRLSRIFPDPPHRTCYLLRLKENRSGKKEMIEHFEREFRQYIQGLPDVIPF